MKNLGEPYKILVIDADNDLSELMNQKFRQEIRDNRYQFIFMNNLNGFREHDDLSLILTDVQLNGVSVLDSIMPFAEKFNIPVVCVSAYGDMNEIRTAMNLGVVDFLTKPLDFGDLASVMMRVIKSKKMDLFFKIKERINDLKTELERHDHLSKKYPNDVDFKRELYGCASQIHALEWVQNFYHL